MSDIVSAFKQNTRRKRANYQDEQQPKELSALSALQQKRQQNTVQQESNTNNALESSQRQNVQLGNNTSESQKLAQLQQLAAQEQAQNAANAVAQQKQQQQQTQQVQPKDNDGWKKYYDKEKQNVREQAFKNDGFGSWLQDVFNAGWDSRLAEQQARNKYANEMINQSFNDDGSVKDANKLNEAKQFTAQNMNVAQQYGDYERARGNAIGANITSDKRDNPLKATANAVRNMDVGNAIFGSNDPEGTEGSKYNTGRDVLKFLTNLVPGIVSAPITGVASASEALYGKGTDEQTGLEKELDALSRTGKTVSSIFDLGGIFIGGSGKALSKISDALFKKGAEKAVKETSKGVIRSIIDSMVKEGAEEATQQAAEFFGNGGKLVTKDGQFDNDSFKELLSESGQAGVLGAIGGGIMDVGGRGVANLIRKAKTNTNTKTDTNSNINNNLVAREQAQENLRQNEKQAVEQPVTEDVREAENVNENVDEDTKEDIAEKTQIQEEVKNTSNSQYEQDIRNMLNENYQNLSKTITPENKAKLDAEIKQLAFVRDTMPIDEYAQKAQEILDKYSQTTAEQVVEPQTESATGQPVNPQDISEVTAPTVGTQASETPANVKTDVTENNAVYDNEDTDGLTKAYNRYAKRYEDALNSGNEEAIRKARDNYNLALEAVAGENTAQYDVDKGVVVNQVLAEEMFNNGVDGPTANSLHSEMFRITDGKPLAHDYTTGEYLYFLEDINNALKRDGYKDAMGNQFQTFDQISKERDNARQQAFQQALEESIAKSENAEPTAETELNDLIDTARNEAPEPIPMEAYGVESEMEQTPAQQPTAQNETVTTEPTEQISGPNERYTKLQEEYRKKIDETGMTPELRRKIYEERYNAFHEGRDADLDSILTDDEKSLYRNYLEKIYGEDVDDNYNRAYITAQREGTDFEGRSLSEILTDGVLSDVYHNQYEGIVTPEEFDASGNSDIDYMIRRDNPELAIEEAIRSVNPSATDEQVKTAVKNVKEAQDTAKKLSDNDKLDIKDIKSAKTADYIMNVGKSLGTAVDNNTQARGINDIERLTKAGQYKTEDAGMKFEVMQQINAIKNTPAADVDEKIRNTFDSLSDAEKQKIIDSRQNRFNYFMEKMGNEQLATEATNEAMLKDAWFQNASNFLMKNNFTDAKTRELVNDYYSFYTVVEQYNKNMRKKIAGRIKWSLNSAFRALRIQTTLNEIPEILNVGRTYHGKTVFPTSVYEVNQILARNGRGTGPSVEQMAYTLPKEQRKQFLKDMRESEKLEFEEQLKIIKKYGKIADLNQKQQEKLNNAKKGVKRKINDSTDKVFRGIDAITQWNNWVQAIKDATFLKSAENFYQGQFDNEVDMRLQIQRDFDQTMLPQGRIYKVIKGDNALSNLLNMYTDSSLRLTINFERSLTGRNTAGVNANYKPYQRIANELVFSTIPKAISAMVMGVPFASVVGLFQLTGEDYSGIDDEDKTILDRVVNDIVSLFPPLSPAVYGWNQFRQDQETLAERGQEAIDNDLRGDWLERTRANFRKTYTPLGNWLDQMFGYGGNLNNAVAVAERGGINKEGRQQYLSPDNVFDYIRLFGGGANRTSQAREYANNPDLGSAIVNQIRNKDYDGDGQADGGFADFLKYNKALSNPLNNERFFVDEDDYNRPASMSEQADYNKKIQDALKAEDRELAQEWYEKSRKYNAILDDLRVNDKEAYAVYQDQYNKNYVTPERWKTVFYGKTSDGQPDLTVWNTMKNLFVTRAKDFYGKDWESNVDPAYTQLDDEQTRMYLQYKSTATGEKLLLKKNMCLDPFWDSFFDKQNEYFNKFGEDEFDDSKYSARVQEWNDWNDQYSDYQKFISGNIDTMKNQQLALELSLQFPLMTEYQKLKTALKAKYGDEWEDSAEKKAFWSQNYDAYQEESDAFNQRMLYIINQMRRIEGFGDMTIDQLEAINGFGKDSSKSSSKSYGGSDYSYAPKFENIFQADPLYAQEYGGFSSVKPNLAGNPNFENVGFSGTAGKDPYAQV